MREEGIIGSIKSLLSRRTVKIKALHNISFSIDKGEFVGYIGPNGAGKTTTLKILSGILYPTSGNVTIFGHIPYKREFSFLRKISIIMGQKSQLWWDLPAMESFNLNKEIYQIPEKDYKKRLKELSELLNVQELLHVPVRKLSLGERMKMELIASLLHSPRVIFLDEPTIGLDLLSQEALRDFLKVYNRISGATIIFTSHNIRDIERLCERTIILHKGEILFDGKTKEIHNKFTKEEVIRIHFKNNIPESISNYGKIVERNGHMVKMRIKRSKKQEIVSELFKKFEILNLWVVEVSLEDAVKEVFKNLKEDEK